MSYHIDRFELSTALPEARANMQSVEDQLQHIHNYLVNYFIGDDSFAGNWADALKTYLQQTHVVITELLMGAIQTFKKLLIEYPMILDPYDINTNVIVDEDHLAEIESWMQDLSRHMQGYHSNADGYLDNVSDIIGSRTMKSIERYIGQLSYLEKRVTELKEGVKENDNNYGRAGLDSIKELMDDVRGILNRIESNGEITAEKCSFEGYYDAEKSDAIYKHVLEASLYLTDKSYSEDVEEYYNAVQEKIENIIECAARERFVNGIITCTIVGAEIVIAIGTVGTATGALLAADTAWAAAGAGATIVSSGATIYFKSGELGEGMENTYYGAIGDVTTPAQNFILVGAYDGDEELMELHKAIISGSCKAVQFGVGLDSALSPEEVAKLGADTIKVQYSVKQISDIIIDQTMEFGASGIKEVLKPYTEDSKLVEEAVDQGVDKVMEGATDKLKDGAGDAIEHLIK